MSRVIGVPKEIKDMEGRVSHAARRHQPSWSTTATR